MSVQCIAEFFDKSCWRIFFLQSGKVTSSIEKPRQRTTRYHVFCSVGHLIQSGIMESCLAAEERFLLFKGPGSFKIF